MLVGCLVVFCLFSRLVCSCIYGLLGVSKSENYINFHLRTLKCRFRMLPFSLFGFSLFHISYIFFSCSTCITHCSERFFKKKPSGRKMAVQCNMPMLLNSISQHMKTCLLLEKATNLIRSSFP